MTPCSVSFRVSYTIEYNGYTVSERVPFGTFGYGTPKSAPEYIPLNIITNFRFNFSTADSSNSVQICQSVGLLSIIRLEVSTRYLISFEKSKSVSQKLFDELASPLHDRMTQCVYTKENLPRQSFNERLPKDLEPWFVVPLVAKGRAAMEEVNQKLGKCVLQ